MNSLPTSRDTACSYEFGHASYFPTEQTQFTVHMVFSTSPAEIQ